MSIGGSFKDTPFRVFGRTGLSYRLDFHKDELIPIDEQVPQGEIKKGSMMKKGKKSKQSKKDRKKRRKKDKIDF